VILFLDHKIFGNGHGMASPYFDDKFYWLSGELYTAMSGLGAQLHSFQWTHPNAGEERVLCKRRFRPLHSNRRRLWLFRDRWFAIPTPISRVTIAWSWIDLPRDLDAAHAALRELRKELGEHIP